MTCLRIARQRLFILRFNTLGEWPAKPCWKLEQLPNVDPSTWSTPAIPNRQHPSPPFRPTTPGNAAYCTWLTFFLYVGVMTYLTACSLRGFSVCLWLYFTHDRYYGELVPSLCSTSPFPDTRDVVTCFPRHLAAGFGTYSAESFQDL